MDRGAEVNEEEEEDFSREMKNVEEEQMNGNEGYDRKKQPSQ